MRANRAFELKVHRSGRGPALLRSPGDVDHIEVLEIDTGEIALFWDTSPSQTGRLARALKADLAQLDAQDFLARWRRYEV
ncbi:MAG TPA: hypothetical protein VFP78_22115 [Solirubrobacteraceae bacterium]|nr:hypothetical protein [Solirubrobacteraceae bacterium]